MPFKKGNKLGEGRPKGLKNKTTLLKEERRAIFDEEVSKLWKVTILKLLKNEPKYVSDQFIGKAKEVITHEGEVKLKIDV